MKRNESYLELALSQERLARVKEIQNLQTENNRLKIRLADAENRYAEIASRCIQLYVRDGTIKHDSIEVRVDVPVFLSQDDLSVAIAECIKNAVLSERAQRFFKRGAPLK